MAQRTICGKVRIDYAKAWEPLFALVARRIIHRLSFVQKQGNLMASVWFPFLWESSRNSMSLTE
jgi:hypothetical protein